MKVDLYICRIEFFISLNIFLCIYLNVANMYYTRRIKNIS